MRHTARLRLAAAVVAAATVVTGVSVHQVTADDGTEATGPAEDEADAAAKKDAVLSLSIVPSEEPIDAETPVVLTVEIKNLTDKTVDVPGPGFINQFMETKIWEPDGSVRVVRHPGLALGFEHRPGGPLKPDEQWSVKLSQAKVEGWSCNDPLTFHRSGKHRIQCLLDMTQNPAPWFSFWKGRASSNVITLDVGEMDDAKRSYVKVVEGLEKPEGVEKDTADWILEEARKWESPHAAERTDWIELTRDKRTIYKSKKGSLQAHVLFRCHDCLYVKVTGTLNGAEFGDHVIVPDKAGSRSLRRAPEFDRHRFLLAFSVGK
jgi:hypothetical protein